MSIDYKFEGWLGHGPEAADGKMEWGSFEPKKWQEDDVDIRVSHCGICATDGHTLRNDWGGVTYPQCVGHEIVGTAVRVGKNIKHVKVGDTVGVGAQARSCLEADCAECSSGHENYCAKSVSTYNSEFPDGQGRSFGGYGTYHRANGHFVFAIPEGLAAEAAAPMLCAGITVYTPLKHNGCGPGKRVGIVGIGGLGHFGILFAKALGASQVVGISRSASKRDDVLALGADEYIATADDEGWSEKNRRSFDLIICTASSASMPLTDYISTLKVGGTFVMLGAHEGGMMPPYSAMVALYNGIKVGGSIIGSREEIRGMLSLAVEKKVTPWIQTRSMKDANQALIDQDKGLSRYRFVLVNDSVQ